jgi:hypothetical protein
MIKTQKGILSSKFSYLLSDDIQSRRFFANAEEMMNRDAESNENQDEVDRSTVEMRARGSSNQKK